MDFIMVPAILLIITYGVYSLFELYARRRERIMMIEKMSQGLDPNKMIDVISPMYAGRRSFGSLKAGFLLAGLGLGLVVAFIVNRNMLVPAQGEDICAHVRQMDAWVHELRTIVYGACLLLFGGISLLAAFLVENNVRKRERK